LIAIKQYTDLDGTSPFGQWLDSLDDPAAARVLTAMTRLEHGNFSSVKGVGGGVQACGCTSARMAQRS
jgi:putative component of toxin-antitoxin plasmid stabilization module